MALINCSECQKEISDSANACPNCGCPIRTNQTTVVVTTKKGFWSTGRLTIGILSIVLFLFVSLQSCASSFDSAMKDNGSTDGSSGTMLALFLLIAGIIGICTRNSTSKIGPSAACFFYWLGWLMTIGSDGTYVDLSFWGFIAFAFGIVFMVSSLKTKKIKK